VPHLDSTYPRRFNTATFDHRRVTGVQNRFLENAMILNSPTNRQTTKSAGALELAVTETLSPATGLALVREPVGLEDAGIDPRSILLGLLGPAAEMFALPEAAKRKADDDEDAADDDEEDDTDEDAPADDDEEEADEEEDEDLDEDDEEEDEDDDEDEDEEDDDFDDPDDDFDDDDDEDDFDDDE
jgi:hypothetical protein